MFLPVGAIHESPAVGPPPGPDQACRGRRLDGPLPWESGKAGAASCSPTFHIRRRNLFVGAGLAPPADLHRAGGVAKQAAVGSAAGGAGKQSEANLEWRFLSSPILSLQEKERMGKRKSVSFPSVLFLPRRTRTLRWAQYLSCQAQERLGREDTNTYRL